MPRRPRRLDRAASLLRLWCRAEWSYQHSSEGASLPEFTPALASPRLQGWTFILGLGGGAKILSFFRNGDLVYLQVER